MEGAQRTTFDQPDPVPPSQAPTAVAGATPTTVPEGGVVQLDGSGSSDPENGALRYAWTQITKPYVGLSSASSDSPSFTAPRGLPMPEPRFLVDGHRPNRRRLQAEHGRGARDLLAAHRQRSIRSRADRPGDLRWRASSSDDTVATVRVVERDLLVEPALASEGRAEIVLVVTDSAGLTATARFEVQVEFHWPTSATRGWRSAVGIAEDAARSR